MEEDRELTDLGYARVEIGGLPFIVAGANKLSDEEISKILALAKRKLMQAAMCQN